MFHVLLNGLQFAKGIMSWTMRMRTEMAKVTLITRRLNLDIWPMIWWSSDRMPSLVTDVVNGHMICKAVCSFNMFFMLA